MTDIQVAEAVSAVGSVVGVSVAITLGLIVLRRGNAAVVAIGVPLAAFLSSEALKLLFHRARPLHALIPLPSSYAFPSGHATAAAATYLTLALLLADRLSGVGAKRLCIAAGALVACAIAWSRVYLGVHYVSDVVAGLLLGTAWALAGRRLYVTRLRPQ